MTSPNSNWHDATAPLWRDNMALKQLLGLCPLLGVTTTAVNGLALGLASAAVVVVASTAISALRPVLVPAARLPLSLLLLAAVVTAIDLFTEALLYDLHELLGLFLPLIVVNSGLLAHADGVAARRGVGFTLLSAVATGLGFMFALVVLGALREIFGRGTLFAGVELLVGESGRSMMLDFPWEGPHAAILPPGAFFGLAVLLALRNRLARTQQAPAESQQ